MDDGLLMAGAVQAVSPRRRLASKEVQLKLVKLLYFLNGFSGASFGRFATLFYLDRGLHAHEIGVVEAVQPLCAAIGNQISGWAADRFQRKKLAALIGRTLSTAALLTLPFVGRRFDAILTVMMVVAFFAVGGGVLDAYTLDLLGHDRRGEYGRYRLWLAVSWGVGNALMGIVAEHNFDLNFIILGVGNAIAMTIMGFALPRRTADESKRVAQRLTRQAWGDDDVPAAAPRASSALGGGASGGGSGGGGGGGVSLWRSVCSVRFFAFLFEMALIGLGFTLVEKFLFVFAVNELDAQPSLCGYSVAVTVVFEIPVFYWGGQLLRTMGHDLMVLAALAAYALRVLGYTYLQPSNVALLLALEPLHGITYGMAWTAAVDRVKAEVPAEWQTTGQLLLNTAMWSVGRTAGSLFGGFFIQHGSFQGQSGGRALYLLAAYGSAALVVLHVLLTLLLRACGRRGLLTPPPEPEPMLQPLAAVAATGGAEREAPLAEALRADASGADNRGDVGGDDGDRPAMVRPRNV